MFLAPMLRSALVLLTISFFAGCASVPTAAEKAYLGDGTELLSQIKAGQVNPNTSLELRPGVVSFINGPPFSVPAFCMFLGRSDEDVVLLLDKGAKVNQICNSFGGEFPLDILAGFLGYQGLYGNDVKLVMTIRRQAKLLMDRGATLKDGSAGPNAFEALAEKTYLTRVETEKSIAYWTAKNSELKAEAEAYDKANGFKIEDLTAALKSTATVMSAYSAAKHGNVNQFPLPRGSTNTLIPNVQERTSKSSTEVIRPIGAIAAKEDLASREAERIRKANVNNEADRAAEEKIRIARADREQADRERSDKLKAERVEKERETAKKAEAEKKQNDKANYLRNFAIGTRLKAVACYGETSVVGVAPKIRPEVVGCVDVHYRAQCEDSAAYVDGIANNFVGMSMSCFGDTYRVEPKPACASERVRVTVREARACNE